MQDLLNAKTSRRARRELNNTFYDASEILPTNPINLQDYRILIIDRIAEVKNAWIQPVKDNLQGIQGLYRILLQIDDDSARDPKIVEHIKQKVFTLFADHRNLCEDLESVEVLQTEQIVIRAKVEIGADSVGEEVLANMLFHLEEHLNPTIRFYTVEELQAEGHTIDEIFEGPPPVNGFIKKQELLPMRQEVYISKLIEIITSIEGVRRIVQFDVEKNGIPVDGDVIPIEANAYPVLDMDTLKDEYAEKRQPYPIQFFRGALQYDTDLNTTNQLLYSLYAQYKKGYQMKKLYDERNFPSTLKEEELPYYHSIQHTFPIVYGLNPMGLPNGVRPTRERLGMIKQLRGYLVVFEQIMANYLAQLANIKQFFSLDKGVNKTYYTQVPVDIPELNTIVRASKMEDFAKQLEELIARFDPYLERRNRTLDHLLARFGEQFQTDFLVRLASHQSNQEPEALLIDAKIDFLQHYVEVSQNRSRGFNYLDGLQEGGWNVSGLEKRLSLLTRIHPSGNESLTRAFLGQIPGLPPIEEQVQLLDENLISLLDLSELQQITQAEDGSQDETQAVARDDKGVDYNQTYFQFPYPSQEALLDQLFENGIYTYNYLIIPIKGTEQAAVFYKGDKHKGVYKVFEAANRHEARQAIGRWVGYLQELSHFTEGMHLVEHILLRPQAKDRHGFRLVNDQGEVLLTSFELGDLQSQRYLSEELPTAGLKPENYQIEVTEDGLYYLVLKDDYGKLIARSPSDKPFTSLEQAQAQVLDLVDYINSFKVGGISIFNNVNFFVEERKIARVKDEFYSLAMTIVLPNWPYRFRNHDFRTVFKNNVMMNVPAHLEVNFLWLDINDMKEFEARFFSWIEARAHLDPPQPQLDDSAYELLEWLSKRLEAED
jgi:hypothetical protein